MRKICFLVVAAIAVFIASCTSDDSPGSTVNVTDIAFNNDGIVNDTLRVDAGDKVKLEFATTPAGGDVAVYVTGTNLGKYVLDYDNKAGELIVNCGGVGEIVAVAQNGTSYTTSKVTVIANEYVQQLGSPKRNLYWMARRANGDINTRSINLFASRFAELTPVTATVKLSVSHTNDTDWTLNTTTGNYYYNHNETSFSSNFTKREDIVTITATNLDGSVLEKKLIFRNAAGWLGFAGTSANYESYGYYRIGMLDGTPTGGWHSNETGNVIFDDGIDAGIPSVQYLLFDLGEDLTMTGLELWRGNNDVAGVEAYYAPSSATVNYTNWTFNTSPATKTWRDQMLADGTLLGKAEWHWQNDAGVTVRVIESPEEFVCRYIMLRVYASNRGGAHSLTEVFPYVVVDAN